MKKKALKKNLPRPVLSIVIPVYNEAKNIEEELKSISTNITSPCEIIVVYDLTRDTTLPVLRRLRSKYRNLQVVKNDIKPGPSGAIRTGFNKSRADRILVTMADLCDDLGEIDKVLRLIPGDADIVCPSRYCKGGGQILESKYKAILPQTAGLILKLLTGITTSDPTNSFKLYSSELIRSLNLKSTVSFSVTLEVMAKAHCLNKRIYEIPTVWHDREHGKTNFKIIPSIITYFPWFCFALLKNRIFSVPTFIIRRFI